MAKCWELVTWDIPLKMLHHFHAEATTKAVVLEAKKRYVKPQGKASCPRCGDKIKPNKHLVSDFIRLCKNWDSDGVFEMDVKCTSDKCGWTGQGGCVLVEVRG